MEPRPPLLSGPRMAAVAAAALALSHATWLVWPRAFLLPLWLRWPVLGVLVLLVLVTRRAREAGSRALMAVLLVCLVGPYVLHTGLLGVHLWRIRLLYTAGQELCRTQQDPAGVYARAGLRREARVPGTSLEFGDFELVCVEGRALLERHAGSDPYTVVDEEGTLQAW